MFFYDLEPKTIMFFFDNRKYIFTAYLTPGNFGEIKRITLKAHDDAAKKILGFTGDLFSLDMKPGIPIDEHQLDEHGYNEQQKEFVSSLIQAINQVLFTK